MMIDRATFHKCMAHIKDTMEVMDKDLDIIESVLGGCEKLSAMIDVSPMLDLMAMVCGDSKGFINMFIFDCCWGEAGYYVVNGRGEKLPFETYDNLYDILKYQCPWELKMSWDK